MNMDRDREEYDVVVIGAGPAGSSAARQLALGGLSTLVVDAQQFPRTKLCGNLISGFCQSLLPDSLPRGLLRGTARGAIVQYGSHELELVRKTPMASFVGRDDFDQFLLTAAVSAGAEFRPLHKVVDVATSEAALLVRFDNGTEVTSRFIIGADGAVGRISRLVRGRRYRRFEQGLSFAVEIPRQQFNPDCVPPDELIFLDVKSIPGGYAWIFPEGNVYNIGIGAGMFFARGLRAQFVSYVRDRLVDPDFEFPVRAHPLPVGGIARRLSRDGILLVGDAAGVIDPISGEGIGFAVLSGQIAAESIIRHPGSRRRAEKTYRQLFKRRLISQLRPQLFYTMLLFLLRPLFFSMLPCYSKQLFELQFNAVSGDISYRCFVFKAIRRLPGLFFRSMWKRLRTKNGGQEGTHGEKS